MKYSDFKKAKAKNNLDIYEFTTKILWFKPYKTRVYKDSVSWHFVNTGKFVLGDLDYWIQKEYYMLSLS